MLWAKGLRTSLGRMQGVINHDRWLSCNDTQANSHW